MATTPVFLPGESQGRLMGCRLWGRTESDTTEATQHSCVDVDSNIDTAADIDTDEDVAEMFPKGKEHAPSLLPPPPK